MPVYILDLKIEYEVIYTFFTLYIKINSTGKPN